MSIGGTVALIIAGIMLGAVLGFCCLALLVSSRWNERRAAAIREKLGAMPDEKKS